jgi:hypothetical protein
MPDCTANVQNLRTVRAFFREGEAPVNALSCSLPAQPTAQDKASHSSQCDARGLGDGLRCAAAENTNKAWDIIEVEVVVVIGVASE